MNLCSFKVYRVYLASLNSVKWSRIFPEVELWMTVSKLKTAGFVQSLEFLKKSWNLPSSFPDLGKVWKIEVKSWKNGKKSWHFLKAVQQVLRNLFFVLAKSYIQSRLHVMEKALFVRFFKFSIDHLFHNLECGKINYRFGKSLEKVLNFGSKICTNPERKGNSSPCIRVLRKRFTS